MRLQIKPVFVFSALIVGGALALRWAEAHGLIDDTPDRSFGVTVGVILAWFGNLAPKKGLDDCPGRLTADHQAMRRFAGRTFVLGGLAYAAAWIVVPSPYASEAAMAAIALALALVLGRALVTRTFV